MKKGRVFLKYFDQPVTTVQDGRSLVSDEQSR